MWNRGAAVVLLIASAACSRSAPATAADESSPGAEAPAPTASAAPKTTTPTARPWVVRVSLSAVADVAMGTAARTADRRLTERIGVPVRRELSGCNGERGHTLTWGRLVAYISDGGEGGAVVLRGWEVTAAATGPRVELPYRTAVGQATAEIRARVPEAQAETFTEGPYAGSYVITTPQAPSLFWAADAPKESVSRASYRSEVCD
jgi:hypothetical protein